MGGFKSSRGERDFSYQGELAFFRFPVNCYCHYFVQFEFIQPTFRWTELGIPCVLPIICRVRIVF